MKTFGTITIVALILTLAGCGGEEEGVMEPAQFERLTPLEALKTNPWFSDMDNYRINASADRACAGMQHGDVSSVDGVFYDMVSLDIPEDAARMMIAYAVSTECSEYEDLVGDWLAGNY